MVHRQSPGRTMTVLCALTGCMASACADSCMLRSAGAVAGAAGRTSAARAGVAARLTALGVVKLTEATATSLAAAPWSPSKRILGAGRPRNGGWNSASTAIVKAAQASQDRSRTPPMNKVPLSLWVRAEVIACQDGLWDGIGEPPSR